MPLEFRRLAVSSTRVLVAGALVLSISACSWNKERSAQIGGVAGGILGGILGSKVGGGSGRDSAMILGATLGAMWGSDVARGMTDVDKVFQERTTADSLEYGKPGEQSTWSNPDSGNSGKVSSGETYQNAEGKDCRQFETTVIVEGEERDATGTACRMGDGEWEVVEAPA
ncbi:RT0821/Lpp0805 family surface protein [Pseudomonadota bacterium]